MLLSQIFSGSMLVEVSRILYSWGLAGDLICQSQEVNPAAALCFILWLLLAFFKGFCELHFLRSVEWQDACR
jgi:hypothetical protein